MNFIRLAVPLLLGVIALPVTATQWVLHPHPLTAKEWLEWDVSGADAIGIGTIAELKDTLVSAQTEKDHIGYTARFLRLHLTRWLKGGNGSTSIEARVAGNEDYPIQDGDPLHSVSGSGRSVLFMVRSVPGQWRLCDDPKGLCIWIMPSQGAQELEREVRRIIAAQEPDSLLAQADLVAVGRATYANYRRRDSAAYCRVIVDSVLAGTNPPGDSSAFVLLTGVVPGDVPPDTVVFVLRAEPDSTYEIVGHRAGIWALRDGRTSRGNLSIEDIHNRLRRLGRVR